MTDGDAETDGRGDPGGAPGEAAADHGGDDRPLDGLVDRPAASAGAVVAALALAAAFLPWTDAPPLVRAVAGASSTPAAVFAGLSLAAFLVARHAVVDRETGATVAGLASAGVLLSAVVRFFAPAVGGGGDPVVGVGLPFAAAAGGVGVALAIADAKGVGAAALAEMVRRTATGFGLMIGAFAALFVVAAPLGGVELGPVMEIVVTVVLTDVVFAAAALAFLVASGRGLAFVDLAWPDVRDLVYVGVGILGLFALLVTVRIATLALDLPATNNRIVEAALEGHPETLLVLVPLSFLLVAPAEELLNRNVIQKYLYGPFSRPAAVLVASLVFALAHVFSYFGQSVVAMVVSLTSVFVLSLVLGAIYERTENLLVPILVHGFFNAAQFALLYVAIVTGEVDEGTMGQAAAALPL